MSRTSARKHALTLIFQIEFYEDFSKDEVMELYYEGLSKDIEVSLTDKEFIYNEFNGTIENLEQIDNFIIENLSSWKKERLNKIDLAIIRLCVYEMLYAKEIPRKVCINEAIELAKIYGDDNSKSFVNGILGEIGKTIEEKDE